MFPYLQCTNPWCTILACQLRQKSEVSAKGEAEVPHCHHSCQQNIYNPGELKTIKLFNIHRYFYRSDVTKLHTCLKNDNMYPDVDVDFFLEFNTFMTDSTRQFPV